MTESKSKRAAPGLLRRSVDPDVLMMLCTAGHVDHGKTRLVGLLTGCKTDRLRAEQERGLTIELGFAPCVLGGDLCVGIVDVPGHEKFVRNMVAGVSGISMAILVIAADDGVMPQTAEHLDIMTLLGVRHGIVALTKTDLVRPERVADVTGEVRGFLDGTFLRDAPICPLSSETGEGVMAFYETLVAHIRNLAGPPRAGVFRMPVERCFTQKGFGAVATGIPVSGAVRVGDPVELVPGGRMGRVRGLQRFLRDADEGGAGQCLALNIADLGKEVPERGQMLCTPGSLTPGRCLHVRVRAVRKLAGPLPHGGQVKLHTGTRETAARLYLLEEKQLTEGQTALATLVTDRPVAAAANDRFLLRRPSPVATVAGGEILRVDEGPARPRKKSLLPQLQTMIAAFEGVEPGTPEFAERQVVYHLSHECPAGGTLESIGRACLLTVSEAETILATLRGREEVQVLGAGHHIHVDGLRHCLDQARRRLETAREQGALCVPLQEFQSAFDWPQALCVRLISELEGEGLLRQREGKLLFGDPLGGLAPKDRHLAEAMLRLYEETGFQSPRPGELPERLSVQSSAVERVLGLLCDEGLLLRLSKNVVLCYGNFVEAQNCVVEHIRTSGALDSADFKEHIGSTRKYALAILDRLDARGVTVRNGNLRKLARGYEERLL